MPGTMTTDMIDKLTIDARDTIEAVKVAGTAGTVGALVDAAEGTIRWLPAGDRVALRKDLHAAKTARLTQLATGEVMPPRKKTAAAAPVDVDALISDVHDIVDQMVEIDPGSDGAATKAGDLSAEADEKIRQLPRKHHTALRKTVADARKAVEDAAEKPEPEPSTEVAVVSNNPLDWEHIPELVAHGVEKVREGVELGLKMTHAGEAVANVILTIRQNMIDPETGLPDLPARMRVTRDAANLVYKNARKDVADDDVVRTAAHESIKKASQNKASDVLVAWLRGYDRNSAESMELLREIFPAAADKVEASEDLSPEAAIRALYAEKKVELPARGRTEAMREDRKVKALVQARRELEAAKDADDVEPKDVEELESKVRELTADLGDAAAKAEELTPEKTDFERTEEALTKVRETFQRAGKRLSKLDEARRDDVKADMYKLISEVADTFGLDLSALKATAK
jgi:hypothetical protein